MFSIQRQHFIHYRLQSFEETTVVALPHENYSLLTFCRARFVKSERVVAFEYGTFYSSA